jgi:hypothetical protein
MRWCWGWGCAFANARRERGLGTKSHETERDGSISGAPCEKAVEGDGVRCRGGVDEMVVGVWPRVRKHEAREGAGAKNHETERGGSISGASRETAVMGGGGRWWCGVDEVVVVVGLRVRQREAGEGTGDQKPRNRALWLGFGLLWGCWM